MDIRWRVIYNSLEGQLAGKYRVGWTHHKQMKVSLNKEVKNQFWKKQFSQEITSKQNSFDVIFGIMLPILCLIFDPDIFRDGLLVGVGYLSSFQIFAYVSIGLGIATLSIWLLSKTESSILIGIISGILFAGALLSLALGVYLLPLSTFGLLLIIGIFGFTPFLTAFAYLRNGIRAIQKIQSDTNKVLFAGTILFGMVFVIGIPFAINWKTNELWSSNEFWVPIERLWLPISTTEHDVIHFVIDNRTDKKIGPLVISDANGFASMRTNQIEPFTTIDLYYENSAFGENAIIVTDSNGINYRIIGYFESPQRGRVDIHIECVTPEGLSGTIRTLVSDDQSQWRPLGMVNCK